jgi:hypothetical protein
MNPLLARADELEKQRRQAEVLRGMTAGMSPAMTTQMTDEQRAILEQQAAQNPETKEAMMAEMLRTGSDALFNTGPAPGKQMGDVYMAPTWSEVLANAVKQGVGGYQMGKARGGLEEAQATRNEASNAKGTLSNAIAKEERDQRQFENDALQRKEQRELEQQKIENEANEAAALLAAEERKESARRWNAEQGIRLGDLQRKKDKDAADTAGSPGGKLFGLQRKIGPDGKPVYIGQNKEGVIYEQGGAEPVNPDDYEDALSASQVAAGVKKLSDDLREKNQMGSALTDYTTAMAPYAVGGEKERPIGEIPGRGTLSGRQFLGYPVRRYEEYVEGEDPGTLFAVGKDIANMKINERSGLATTLTEIERVRPVLEGELGSDPRLMHDAITRVQKAYEKDLALLREGTSPQVLAQYEATAGENNMFKTPQTYLEFPKAGGQAPQPSPSPMPTPTGKKSIKGLTPAQIDKMSAEELSQYEF